MSGRALACVAAMFLLGGCSWWEEDVLHVPPTPEFVISDNVDRISFTASDAGDKFNYSWSSSLPFTIIQDPKDKLTSYFKIPKGFVSTNADITLDVSRKKRSKSTTLTITVPTYSLVRDYGLGKSAIVERSNNVDYEWYIDQKTGTYPAVDCGPTSVTMAIKWFNRNFQGTPAMARAAYRPGGGWWFTGDVGAYLVNNSVTHSVISLANVNDLKREIDNGSIIILCLDMYYVSGEFNAEYRVNKFYKTAAPEWGHFIVIKGYKEVETDGNKLLYMEVNDPFSQGVAYSDNTLKGKDRYYLGDDLIVATKKWWPYAIVISKTASNARMGLDWADVPSQKGR